MKSKIENKQSEKDKKEPVDKKRIKKFVDSIFKKYGKMLSKLAHE